MLDTLNNKYVQTGVTTGLVAGVMGTLYSQCGKTPGNEYMKYYLPISTSATLLMPTLSKHGFQPATHYAASLITSNEKSVNSVVKFVDEALNMTLLSLEMCSAYYGCMSNNATANTFNAALAFGALPELTCKIANGKLDNVLKDVGIAFTSALAKKGLEQVMKDGLLHAGALEDNAKGSYYNNKLTILVASTLAGTITKDTLKGGDRTMFVKDAVASLTNNLLYDMAIVGQGLNKTVGVHDFSRDVAEIATIEILQPYLNDIIFGSLGGGAPQEVILIPSIGIDGFLHN